MQFFLCFFLFIYIIIKHSIFFLFYLKLFTLLASVAQSFAFELIFIFSFLLKRSNSLKRVFCCCGLILQFLSIFFLLNFHFKLLTFSCAIFYQVNACNINLIFSVCVFFLLNLFPHYFLPFIITFIDIHNFFYNCT